jgi:hypothetical protein
MSYARQLLDTYPGTVPADASVLAAAIDALNDCAQACTADAGADLSEDNLADMVRCIRLFLDSTDVCTATAGVISRPAEYDASVTRPLLEACVAHLPELRRRVRAACPAPRALPGLRRGLPPLRAGLPGPAGRLK